MPSLKDTFLYFYLPKVHRLFYANKPNVLVNSIQKAGTHMLVNALAKSLPLKYNERGTYNHSLVQHWPAEKLAKNTTPQTVIDFLENQAWPGELVRGHVAHDAELSEHLKKAGIPVVLLVRNPLDMLLSLANWWERHPEIPVTPFLTYKKIEKAEDRLQFLMTGKMEGAQIWPDFVTRTHDFLGWQTDANCLILKYEDLLADPAGQAEKLSAFLPVSLKTEKFIQALNRKDNRTYTQADEKVFKMVPAHILKLYKEQGGEALHQKMGYTL